MLSEILEAGGSVKKGVLSAIKDFFKDVDKFFNFFDESKVAGIITKIVIAILIYFIGRKIVKMITRIVERSLKKSNIELSVSKFLCRLTSVAGYAILVYAIVYTLGVPTSSFVALFGTAGLAIGLSLQGSLHNFAGGVRILILKPLCVNDYIVASDIEGKVTAIDIFYTKLITPDNKKVVIPNGTLSNCSIKNVPYEAKRRLDIIVPVDYNADIKHVRLVLNLLASKDERVSKDDPVTVTVDELGDSSINIGFKMWVETTNYLAVKTDMLEKIIDTFREENINIPYNKLDVNIMK